jgi:hypothetical protein
MLLTVADWPADRRPSMLARWAEIAKLYPLTLNIVTADIEEATGHVDSRLLLLARALEGLHRRRYPVSEAVREKHAARMTSLRALVADRSLWRWAHGHLRRGYEPSLESRVKALLDATGDSLQGLIPDHAYCRAFADYRNAYVQEDPEREEPPENVKTLLLVMQTRFLLIAWLLVEMGFATDEVKGFLERNAEYQHFSAGFPDSESSSSTGGGA